jgi:hypothetical protein
VWRAAGKATRATMFRGRDDDSIFGRIGDLDLAGVGDT